MSRALPRPTALPAAANTTLAANNTAAVAMVKGMADSAANNNQLQTSGGSYFQSHSDGTLKRHS
jgi:hypothetical protein